MFHAPLRAGNNLHCEDGAVVFRAIVEDHVTLRQGATVAGNSNVILREGTIVPKRTVIETQEPVDALATR